MSGIIECHTLCITSYIGSIRERGGFPTIGLCQIGLQISPSDAGMKLSAGDAVSTNALTEAVMMHSSRFSVLPAM
ncbi:hypothetical protein [Paenibacillus periandrae]|uniref:hypothetical protein n=1 Tax=Paenibacillus periandrae TaxID=1761741 RepID=UPI001F09D1DA|nr:hypothetical protein [Paenibacillus periandrae]